MKTTDLQSHLKRVALRKAELGLVDTAEQVAAMRNPGTARTAEKRELLRRAEARALAAGIKPIISHF